MRVCYIQHEFIHVGLGVKRRVAKVLWQAKVAPIAGCNGIGLGDFAFWNDALGGVPYLLGQLF